MQRRIQTTVNRLWWSFLRNQWKTKSIHVDVCKGPKYTSDMIRLIANSESTVNYIPLGEFYFLQSPLI